MLSSYIAQLAQGTLHTPGHRPVNLSNDLLPGEHSAKLQLGYVRAKQTQMPSLPARNPLRQLRQRDLPSVISRQHWDLNLAPPDQ
jgi:hypothetical protein